MPRNIEIKAKVHDFKQLLETSSQLSDTKEAVLVQHDVFYKVTNGRLKLRSREEDGKKESELIFYSRPDGDGPKLSDFTVSPVPDFDTMNTALTSSCGVKGEVKKERHLFMVGQTRVHCDKVTDLGEYMELEVMLKDGQSEKEGMDIAECLMMQLGISKSDLVSGAYLDLKDKLGVHSEK